MPTNKYGNKKPTKDGQSRTMRQNMAAGRRARGERGITSAPSEGRSKPTTSQQRGNRITQSQSSRAKGALDKMTTGSSQQQAKNVEQLRSLLRIGSLLSNTGMALGVFNQGTSARDTLTSQGMYEGGEKAGPPVPVPKVRYPTAAETQAEERRRRGAESFDLAFAKAYRAGRETFEWRGKTYTTEMA